jgi:MoxR-like ATPase
MAAEKTPYVFTGDLQRTPDQRYPGSPEKQEPYIPSEALLRAVNLAIRLGRPLILEGEAGCGKTRLARAVAYELGLPFYAWPVRSTSKAQEGLYTYDAILRLHDVHAFPLEQAQALTTGQAASPSTIRRDPRQATDYRTLGPLGLAFSREDCPSVVLIDEIDKAEIDFPNDLLAVLDDPWQFTIPETGEMITATHRPTVIITSNKEKGNLPAPFLRRCIYHFVEFPGDEERLKEIVAIHYKLRNSPAPPSKLIAGAIDRFLAVRAKGDLYKAPGTSEFLDWLEALRDFTPKPFDPALLAEGQPFPYPELLFKLRADWQRYTTTL